MAGTKPPAPQSLSPLERELLGYVETLMNALQSGTAQFEALEKRSTDMIENRQVALEGSLKSLIASQATWATIATLLQTAKMNDVDPLAWLTQTLVRMANQWSAQDIEAVMPWNFKPEVVG